MTKKNEYQNKWIAENYDVFKMKMPKGEKEKLKKLAQKEGFKSVSEYLRSLYKDKIQNTPGGGYLRKPAAYWRRLNLPRIKRIKA